MRLSGIVCAFSSLALIITSAWSNVGRQNQKLYKSQARTNRIAELQSRNTLTTSSSSRELNSLMRADSYDSRLFSDAHRHFKCIHNNAFVILARYCLKNSSSARVFYLDGYDGSTTSALLAAGFLLNDLFVANIFPDTVQNLKSSHGLANIFLGRAQDALASEPLMRIQFAAYYLDCCGGSPGPIIDMIDAIFSNTKRNLLPLPRRFVVGITLTESDPSGRSLADREQDVTTTLSRHARLSNYTMEYVGDDPEKYGLKESPQRRHGCTQTVWLVMQAIYS